LTLAAADITLSLGLVVSWPMCMRTGLDQAILAAAAGCP